LKNKHPNLSGCNRAVVGLANMINTAIKFESWQIKVGNTESIKGAAQCSIIFDKKE